MCPFIQTALGRPPGGDDIGTAWSPADGMWIPGQCVCPVLERRVGDGVREEVQEGMRSKNGGRTSQGGDMDYHQ